TAFAHRRELFSLKHTATVDPDSSQAERPPTTNGCYASRQRTIQTTPSASTNHSNSRCSGNSNRDPVTKTVPVTIGRLRRKSGEPRVIETTPGVGHRIR